MQYFPDSLINIFAFLEVINSILNDTCRRPNPKIGIKQNLIKLLKYQENNGTHYNNKVITSNSDELTIDLN